MTQTRSTDPGDIRQAYDRSDEYLDDAQAWIIDTLDMKGIESLPEDLRELIKAHYGASERYAEVTNSLIDEARRAPEPGDGDYLGDVR